ncbi:MAG: hypothetical protein ACI9DF_004508 [Verrucomicrobiales bacterium]|jgi:hypothetical protein
MVGFPQFGRLRLPFSRLRHRFYEKSQAGCRGSKEVPELFFVSTVRQFIQEIVSCAMRTPEGRTSLSCLGHLTM